jgi:hypothetical protein
MVFSVNYNGLKKRESYDDLVRYIETDPNKIKYPDRRATQLEQSHYMKHLGAEDYNAMEEEQLRANKEQVKETIIRETASRGEGSGGGTSSLLRHEATRKEPPPVATPRPEAKQFGQMVENAVEGEKGKKTDKRFENLAMVSQHLGSDVPMVVEAANQAETARGKLRAKRSEKPLVQQALETPDEPMIQLVGDPMVPDPAKEVRYSKGEMRRMRKKGAFPEPSGGAVSLAPGTPAIQQVRESTPAKGEAPAILEGSSFTAARRRRLKEKGPDPYAPSTKASSSSDPAGSSSSADYQRRMREEELLRLEHERLVSQRLQEEAEGQAQAQKEARRGRSRTVKAKPEQPKELEAGEARARSRSQKKKKEKDNAMALEEEKKDEKKRQKDEEGEKREEKKPKKESKTEYFSIGDIERPKTKKQQKEEEKEDKRKRARTEKEEAKKSEPEGEAERRPAREHGTKIDNKKTKSYWEKKSNAYIIDQLSLHGVRIDPSLLSGRKTEFDVVKDKNITVKVKKITKQELLNMLYKELKMS